MLLHILYQLLNDFKFITYGEINQSQFVYKIIVSPV